MKDLILKYALQNAVRYNGKANPGAVIGKILSANPDAKSKMNEIKKEVDIAVKEVNSMSIEEQTEKLNQLAPELLVKKKKEVRKELPDLPGAKDGEVVTRIPPEPSKYNHLGHALSFLINYMYAKKYHGKCILRFEDTNPEKAEQEYVDAMKSDVLEYLDIKPDKTVFVSDDMDVFYDLAEKLIKDKKAYVCFCERETMQELRHKGRGCECRGFELKRNLEEWKNMLSCEYKEGKAVLRLKIDMKAANQVLRDPVIFRIVETPHYRQKDKYCVWPLYDFENAVEENLCGITHILRSNEFGKMRAELQDFIKDSLKFKKQVIIEYGRFNIKGKLTQGREIRKLIEEKKVNGWDDPRLITLKALKRRGIVKEAYYELVHEVGLTPNQTNLDFGVLATINRRILDPKAHRYFFIPDPVSITITDAPEQKVELDLHPDNAHGGRKFNTKDEFFITAKDFKEIKANKLIRLMDCLNFKKVKNKFTFVSVDYKDFKEKGDKIIHWLPVGDVVNVEVVMDDASVVKGFGEKTLENLKEGEVVQLERFGFCRLDKKGKEKLVFWFTHK
jgi:glutamyl-tRNA synthetase